MEELKIIEVVLKCNLRKIAYEGGRITDARGRVRELDKKWRIYLTNIHSDELNNAVSDLYDPSDKFAPKASKVLEEKGDITELNLSTIFEIPTKIEGEVMGINDAIGGEDVPCTIKIVCKQDSTIYPVSLIIHKNGELNNPFEGME